MKKQTNPFLLSFLLAFSVNTALASNPSARDIVQSMLDREDGHSQYTLSQLMSCRFKQKKGRFKCVSKPRVKLFEGLSKDVGKNLEDSRSLSIIIKPAAEKGLAFLQNDYDDTSKDSEQWMYLPSMKKLKRIISETDDGAKTGSLFGSEISYEDIEKRHLDDYQYQLLGEQNYHKRPVWLIKSTPTAKQAKKTSYSYTKSWIDKEKLLPLKIEMYDRQGRLKKTMLQQKIQNIDGINVARQILIIHHANQRMSMMRISKIALNIDIPDDLLGIRALNDANYRENQLKPIRHKAHK